MGSSTRFLFLFSPPPPLLLLRRHSGDLTNLRRIHRRVALPCSLSTFCPEARHPRRLSVPSPPTPPPPMILALSFRRLHTYRARFSAADSFPTQRYPLPEWSELLHALSRAGYFSDSIQTFGAENDVVPNFPDELFRPAYACLALARDRPNLLPLLSKIDVELVVENVTPFLFKNGEDSVRKMRLYLSGGGHGTGNMLDMDTATTVDLMRYLLSYVGNFTYSHGNNPHNREITELSVRRLLSEIAKLSFSTPESNVHGMVQNQFPDRRGQAPRPFQQNVEMKRGDWICPRCNFMNFARNVKCLECEEARPKRQLTGGEWECPQCDFYNYGRNTVCLRCDCKKPGEISLNSANYGYSDNQDLKRRLAENEEKAQRWFSKVSQLESSTSDMSSAIKDEDFPEIMPLRKGVNRFVVSTRKTPLERRLANAQNRINLGGNGTGNENKMPKTKTWGRLDEILGSSSSTDSESADKNASSRQFRSSPQSDPEFVPFVPLPADMFAKKPEEPDSEKTEMGIADNNQMGISEKNQNVGSTDSSKLCSNTINEAKMDEMEEKEEEGKPARWFKRVTELHNVSDVATSDEDFPEIMPMRRGENQFVVSRRKDRSLTSPAYKRRAAMEQARDSNFVPFVPFPPDYFAKKKQPEKTDSVPEASGETTDDNYGNASNAELTEQSTSKSSSWNNAGTADFTPEASGENSAPVTDNNYRNASQVSDTVKRQTPGHANKTHNDGLLKKEQAQRPTGMTERTESSRNWENSWSGKSLEGSAVKEPDPLDMSEEAKAERWFRRVAQIKDISELSQIPDEDFPSIMPMRKGVNRFVVSKRKTPLERRLASQQYRRNSPAESSDPPVKGDK